MMSCYKYVDILFKKFKWCDIIYIIRYNNINFEHEITSLHLTWNGGNPYPVKKEREVLVEFYQKSHTSKR
jgi:hypothetical protein